jgi:hypothetical protein
MIASGAFASYHNMSKGDCYQQYTLAKHQGCGKTYMGGIPLGAAVLSDIHFETGLGH